jgi:hypothetical protein
MVAEPSVRIFLYISLEHFHHARTLYYVGITIKDKVPYIVYQNGQGNIIDVRTFILVGFLPLNSCSAIKECWADRQEFQG